MGNSHATVGAADSPKPAELLADVSRRAGKSAESEKELRPRRSGSLLRRNASIRSSMRKNRPMGLQPRRNFLLRRKTRAPPRRCPQTPDEKELLAAAGRGDLQRVLQALRNGVALETADANEMTALHHAAKHAREDVVRSLLDRGADAKATDLVGGFSPLHWVIINSCPPVGSTNHVDECIVALARGGCDMNATDFNLATPLHIAAQKGHRSTIDTLVRLGANPQAKDVMGRSCLEVAKNDATREFIRSLHSKKESVIYHVLEVPPSRSPSPPTLPEPVKKPRLSAINITSQTRSSDSDLFRNLPQFRCPPDSPGYPAPPPPQSPTFSTPISRNSTPEYSVVDIPLPYKYRPLPLPPTQIPSPLYRYSSAYSSPVPPPPHAVTSRRASRKFSSNLSSRPHRFH